MSLNFNKRTFNYSGTNIAVIKDTNNISQLIEHANTDIDYLGDINKCYKFVDISSSLNTTFQKKTYYINNNVSLDQKQVNDLFNMISSKNNNQKELYDMFNLFLLSKDHFHFVINNFEILNKMKYIINKFKYLYKYIIGYTWLYLYIEECIIKTNITKKNKIVFNIDTASALPIFPYCSEDLHLNPYMALPISTKVINTRNNWMSLKMANEYKNYGINNYNEFCNKFNLFITGYSDKNLFDGLDWTHFGVSGSIIPACSIRSPLMDLISDDTLSEDQKLTNFYNEYYCGADVDIMCNNNTTIEYIHSVYFDLFPTIKKNVANIWGSDASNLLKIELIKDPTIILNKLYFDKFADEFSKHCYINNYEDLISNINKPIVKSFFYDKYINYKNILNSKMDKDSLNAKNNLFCWEYLKISQIESFNVKISDYKMLKKDCIEYDNELYYYVNDFLTLDEYVSEDENYLLIKMGENVKFKITEKNLAHNIETFRIKSQNKDFFSTVSRFHLPCVRGYFDGRMVYLLPSCITALMTGINIDYKYFAGIRDPCDIINKYRSRGFGTIVTKHETIHIKHYLSSVNRWNAMYLINSNKDIYNFFGFKDINDEIFKMNKHLNKNTVNYNNINNTYIESVDDLINYYKKNIPKYHTYEDIEYFCKFKAINSNGKINPFKKWVLDAVYHD